MDAPKITGYRELTAEDVKLKNVTKENAALVGELCDGIAGTPGVDQRWVEIARTDLQKGLMALVRSIAKPEGF